VTEIWYYLYCLYATNRKVSDFDIIEWEDIVEIKESVNHKVENDIDSCKKHGEMINANEEIQKSPGRWPFTNSYIWVQ